MREVHVTVHQLDDFAHRLFQTRGYNAEFEAAQNARNAKDPMEAANWRRVRELVRQLRAYNLG